MEDCGKSIAGGGFVGGPSFALFAEGGLCQIWPMWDLDLSPLAPSPRALQEKESPRDRQSGTPTLCKERKGWATQALCSVKVGHPPPPPTAIVTRGR